MIFSAIGEIANIISGKVISLLKSDGRRLDITPPIIIKTSAISISIKIPILCIPFKRKDKVVFEINYSLEN